jgi:hypothetical protein
MECAFTTLIPMETLTISPPFTYSYQCGSTLLVYYIPVYMYSISLQMLVTFLKLGIIFSVNLFPPTDQMLQLYSILHWPLFLHKLSSLKQRQLIEPPQIISNTMNNIILLLSFGLCSPVLGFYIVMSITVNLCSWLMLVGRFLMVRIPSFSSPTSFAFNDSTKETDEEKEKKKCVEQGLTFHSSSSGEESIRLLNQQIQGVEGYLVVCKWPVICTSCFFMTLLCWDIAGDKMGWFGSLWVPLSGVVILVIVILWDLMLRRGMVDDSSISLPLPIAPVEPIPKRNSETHSPLQIVC